jgi:hypothetical protein
MGLFDSLRDAIRPDDDRSVSADGAAADAKHADRSAAAVGDVPPAAGIPSGGKHARRD